MKLNQEAIRRPARLRAQLPPVLAVALWLGALPNLLAQGVPDYMNYQGILLQGNGAPVTGQKTVEFRIWDALTGGTLLWARSHLITPDANGAFNVVLMEGGNPIATDPSPQHTSLKQVFTSTGSDLRYIELTVQGSTPISPRQRFVPAPYAFLAADARTLNQRPPEDYFLPPGMIVPFAGPANNVPNGWLLCDGTSVGRTDYPRLFNAIGTAWGNAKGGETNFDLPDLRGMFLRGVSGSRSDEYKDPDAGTRTVGSIQGHGVATHNHQWGQTSAGEWYSIGLQSWTSPTASSVTTIIHPFVANTKIAGTLAAAENDNSFRADQASLPLYTKPDSTEYRTGETRPNNACVNYIIKY